MVTIAQLGSIPYLDATSLSGRFVPSLCFYDGGWRMWLAAGEQSELLIETKAVPAEACYFAADREAECDLALPFLDFLAQRACFQAFQKAFSGILDDLFNLSGSLAKIALLQQSREAVPHGLSRMVTSEVEYVIFVCRSLFDLLQEVIAKLWDSIALLDQAAHKQKLKTSFADMLTYKGAPASADAIAARFGLPLNVGACYERGNAIFSSLKQLRDNLVHKGSQLPHIYSGEDIFLIAREHNPFPSPLFWDADECRPNDLVPLLPVIETIIYRTLMVFDEFSSVLLDVIQFPPPLCPGMHFFARGYFTGNLCAALVSGERRSMAADAQRGTDGEQ
jgi:hypothetical protein